MKYLFTYFLVFLFACGSLFAQKVDHSMKTSESYTIQSAAPATDAAATYRWTENGNIVSGAATTYTIPTGHTAGVYSYVRQAKCSGCADWQSSNAFTVSILEDVNKSVGTLTGSTYSFTDPRDGSTYKLVRMPDGKVWFGENLRYIKDLNYNGMTTIANGSSFTTAGKGSPAIGSYWCNGISYGTNDQLTNNMYPVGNHGTATTYSAAYQGPFNNNAMTCARYGALYTWETVMMVDGKYADEAHSASGLGAWQESWVSGNYFTSGAASTTAKTKINNARGAEITGNAMATGGGRGICPQGFHVPTDYEWANLLDKVEGDGSGSTFTLQPSTGWWGADAGKKLKTTSQSTSASIYSDTDTNPVWLADATHVGTDAFGFSVVPAGYRANNGSQFYYRGIVTIFWSSSVYDGTNAWDRQFYYNHSDVSRYRDTRSGGFSVRCVRD